MDHAATTPVDPRVLEAMLPYFSENFGNPGSMHQEGSTAKVAVYQSRKTVADILSASPNEILFTASGTESNNLAIVGFAARLEATGRPLSHCHFMTSAIEHPSVLDCFKELERRAARVSYLPVGMDGVLDLTAFSKELGPETVFISVMLANNEIGTIQPVSEIAKLLARKQESHFFKIPESSIQRPVLHCDASQAPLYLPIDVKKLGVDLLALDAQKIYGPKGVGVLYRKNGVEISPILHGGSQEFGMRPGTENVPGIVGFAKALSLARDEWEDQSVRLTRLRDECIRRILEIAPRAELNGSREKRLPNNINISFPGIDAEWILFQLDARGIAVGTRSACMSREAPGSYVIAALGKGNEYAASSVRITLGRSTESEDIDALIAALKLAIAPVCSRCRTPMPDPPTIYAHQDGSACHDIKWELEEEKKAQS